MWQLSQKHIVHNLRKSKENFMVVLLGLLNKKTVNSRKFKERDKNYVKKKSGKVRIFFSSICGNNDYIL